MTDFDRKGVRAAWTDARRAEGSYNTRLRQVARQIGAIVKGLAPDGVVRNVAVILRALDQYAALLEPWAESVGEYMVRDVGRRNERIWKSVGKQISDGLREEISQTPQGLVYRDLMRRQVPLIQSLPLDAAKRVHELTTGAIYSGDRPEVIAKQILRTQDVSIAKARLIARTEVARTAATLMQARAMQAGSEGYIWRTSTDSDVRDTHKAMEGKYVRWDSPPKTDKGLDPYHAGCGPNCRCFAEPVFADL